MQYIVAGTLAEYRDWLQTNNLNPGDHKFVSGVDCLRGISNPHGRFIGSFRQRTDLRDIITQIAISINFGNMTPEFNDLYMESKSIS